MGTAWPASRTWGASRSAAVWTASDRIPSRSRVRMIRRAISPRLAINTESNISVSMPVHRAGGEGVAAERPAERRLDGPGAVEQRGQVDPGLDPHLVEHRDEVLGGDVAGGARGDRAAAE